MYWGFEMHDLAHYNLSQQSSFMTALNLLPVPRDQQQVFDWIRLELYDTGVWLLFSHEKVSIQQYNTPHAD